jgi:hypothetical protein
MLQLACSHALGAATPCLQIRPFAAQICQDLFTARVMSAYQGRGGGVLVSVLGVHIRTGRVRLLVSSCYLRVMLICSLFENICIIGFVHRLP